MAGLEEKIRNEYSNRVTSESSTKDGVTYTDFTRYRKTASGEIKAISKGAGGITINPSTISKNSLDNMFETGEGSISDNFDHSVIIEDKEKLR